MSLNALDIIILLCFIPALIRGLRKGFVEQLVGIATIFLGAFLSSKFATVVTSFLAAKFPSSDIVVLKVLSFALIFLVVFIVLWLLGRFIRTLLKITTLTWLNRLLGLVLSIVTTLLILGIVFSLLDGVNEKFSLIKAETLQGSVLYNAIHNFSSNVLPFLESFFSNV